MAKKVKKDSASEFPQMMSIIICDRNEDNTPSFLANPEGEEIGSFHEDDQPYVATYQLVKVQRLEKIERLVDL